MWIKVAAKLIIYFCALLCGGVSYGDIIPPYQAMRSGFDKLIFSDEFNTLDLSFDGGGDHYWYNAIWTMAPVDGGLFSVRDGILSLRTPPVNRWGATTAITTMPRVVGGHATKFLFGYFEARLKFNNHIDNWAAFWLYSAKRTKNLLPNSSQNGIWCEIDILESMYPDVYAGTIHQWSSSGDLKNSNAHMHVPKGMSINDEWNIFGLLWEPGKVTWYLNDVKVDEAFSFGACDEDPMFLIIGSQKKRGDQNFDLNVDWVKVWGTSQNHP